MPTLLGWLARKGGQRDRRDGGIHPEAKHPAIDGQHHDKGQHRDEQAADQRHGPQRMLSQKPQALIVSMSSCGSVVLPMPLAPMR